ncbi:MAG: DUF4232 domain-containing protein [Phycicoccus sp.]|nr:DUF4232 domain-containing protein [Phycicoccus sp.]
MPYRSEPLTVMLRLMKVAGLGSVVLVALLGVAGCTSGYVPGTAVSTGASTQLPSGSSSSTPVVPRSGPTTTQALCDGAALSLEVADAEGGGTGQTAVLMTVRNPGPTACMLKGYPRLTALDASGTVLPFTIHYGGSQSVTNQQPEAVTIGPGGSAFVTFGKYRCDVGDKAQVQEVKVILPNTSAPTVLDLTALSHDFAFCGPGDPGSELAVSPVEPTAAKTRSH